MKDPENRTIAEEIYTTLLLKMMRLISSETTSLSKPQALKEAKADWKRDSRGEDSMDLNRFCDSIFEIADVWAETVVPFEYEQIIERILFGITEELADGSLKLACRWPLALRRRRRSSAG